MNVQYRAYRIDVLVRDEAKGMGAERAALTAAIEQALRAEVQSIDLLRDYMVDETPGWEAVR